MSSRCQRLLLPLSTFVLAALPAAAQTVEARFLRIMPLGDSNTEGAAVVAVPGGSMTANGAGYRKRLYNVMTSLPGWDSRPNLVGERFGSQDPIGLIDHAHEGYPGATIKQVADWHVELSTPPEIIPIEARLAAWDPAVVLLNAGTNDLTFLAHIDPVSEAPARLDALISRVVAYNPDIQVLVGNLIATSWATPGDAIEVFNATLPGIVTAHQAQGHHVHLVDLHTAVGSPLQPGDVSGVHPTQWGYDRMADAWLLALAGLGPLKNPNPGRSFGIQQTDYITLDDPSGPAPWSVSSSDLIDRSSPTLADSQFYDYAGVAAIGTDALNDGLTSTKALDVGTTPSSWASVFHLNLNPATGGSSQGYDIESITSFSHASLGQSQQSYRVEVRTVASGSTWVLLGGFHHIPVASIQTGAKLLLNHTDGSVLASSVTALRFSFLEPPTGGTASYLELDVHGRPTP